LKVKLSLLAYYLCCLIISGCVSGKAERKDEKAQPVMQNDDSPSIVNETDIKNIDWDKTVTKIGTNGNSDILGNPKKSVM
jgi:hypothetical protein